MLTVRQLLVTAGQSPEDGELTTRLLRDAFPGRSLSLRSLITAFESQHCIVFVELISPWILARTDVRTPDDIFRVGRGPDGQPSPADVDKARQGLRQHGLLLKLVSPDRRRGAIIGSTADIATMS